MIQVQNLSKQFAGHTLFDDVSLAIGEKEKVGLIGRNGSGKSTFIKILLGEDVPDFGEVMIPSRVRVQSLEQHMDFSQPTILQQVCLALPPEDEGQEWKAESILMGLGFGKEDVQRAPEEFSSGMQVRLRLAQALVSNADLLLLDEPTNYLDITSLRWLERFLQSWNGSFVLVTHDRTFMEKVVTHTVGIHRGKMRKMKGGPQKMMDQIAREEEVHERTRLKQEKKIAKTEKFIREFRAGARSAGLVQSRIKSLEKQDIFDKLQKLPQIRFKFESEVFHGSQMLAANNLQFGYEPDQPLIKGFSLRVRPKDRIGIVGPNGKGKSTLLKLLVGELESQSGKLKPHVNLNLGYFGPRTVQALNPQKSILEELMGLPRVKEQQVRSVCAALLFTGHMVKKKIGRLSGGERARVAMAQLMLSKHNMLVLDEPTNHLDMESCQALIEALQGFPGALLFVSHDERLIHALAKRLVVFDAGRIEVMDRTYKEFLSMGGWSVEENLKSYVKPSSSNKEDYERRKQENRDRRARVKAQQKLEKKIIKMEEELEALTEVLNQAYAEKNTENMLNYGAKAKELHQAIEAAYEELEKMLDQ